MIIQKDMVIDAFPGFNEVELAEFRISYLKDVVDKVIIVESELTHSGLSKPLYFANWLANQSQTMKDRILVINVDLSNFATSWEREIHTREFLFDYISQKYPMAKYILSDLDEIPSKSQVLNLRSCAGNFHFHTPTSYRRLNWQLSDSHTKWKLGVMGLVSENREPNAGRFTKFPLIPGDPGAHFSYLGSGSKEISEKYIAFAHTELNKKYWTSEKLIEYCDRYRIDHLGRSRSAGSGIFKVSRDNKNDVVESARRYFPQYFDLALDLPHIFMRYIASIRVSSYVGEGRISKTQQRLIQPGVFFSSRSPLVQIGPILEGMMTILAQLKLVSSDLKMRILRSGRIDG